jgi:hypothetical protein
MRKWKRKRVLTAMYKNKIPWPGPYGVPSLQLETPLLDEANNPFGIVFCLTKIFLRRRGLELNTSQTNLFGRQLFGRQLERQFLLEFLARLPVAVRVMK